MPVINPGLVQFFAYQSRLSLVSCPDHTLEKRKIWWHLSTFMLVLSQQLYDNHMLFAYLTPEFTHTPADSLPATTCMVESTLYYHMIKQATIVRLAKVATCIYNGCWSRTTKKRLQCHQTLSLSKRQGLNMRLCSLQVPLWSLWVQRSMKSTEGTQPSCIFS